MPTRSVHPRHAIGPMRNRCGLARKGLTILIADKVPDRAHDYRGGEQKPWRCRPTAHRAKPEHAGILKTRP